MKCVKIVGPKQLEVAEINEPKSQNGSVVIKVATTGICGSDIHYWVSGQPEGLVMGHEFAGTVVDPGSRIDLKTGDRVTGLPISPCLECDACKTGDIQYCSHTWEQAVGLSLTNPGGYANYISCRPDMVKILPDEVTFEEASMVEPSAVALHAINLAKINVGTKVAIIGGGIIGLMSAEFAKIDGATYIALLETNKARGTKSLTFNTVDEYYDATATNTVPTLLEKTNGGFDIIIECCGNSSAVTEAISLVKPGGRIILVGVSLDSITIPSVGAVLKEITMQGAIAYDEKEFDTCIKLIANKHIDVEKYIDATVPLEQTQASFERLTSGQDDAIKIMLKP